jgi:hypothetical protein
MELGDKAMKTCQSGALTIKLAWDEPFAACPYWQTSTGTSKLDIQLLLFAKYFFVVPFGH